MPQQPTIYAIDDHLDELILVRRVTESIGVPVETFESPEEFMVALPENPAGCIIVDLMMPTMSGLQLHEELAKRKVTLPMIIVTGHADAKTCRQALQMGVFDFVEKSWNPFDILEVIQRALKKFDDDIGKYESQKSTLLRLDLVSKREKEVMTLLAAGRTLKELAEALCISVQTVSKHRVSLFRKLEVTNEVEMLKFLMSVDSSYGDAEAQEAA